MKQTANVLIKAQDLRKAYGKVKAVNGISLQVAAGEIYGLVGPDGAGKTTTIRLLCGALRADAGHAQLAGYDLIHETEEARTQVGYLPQRFSLYEELTVMENLRFFAEVHGLPPANWRPRCLEILKFVGLADFTDRRAGHLSGGMKQKLGLAVALVHRPRVFLLDEPTTGVDPVSRQDFWQLIMRLVSSGTRGVSGEVEGVAVLISTPYMDEAARCTRVGFMESGRMLVEGTPGELRANFQGQVVELQGEPLPLLRNLVREDQDVENAQMFGDRLHLRISPARSKEVFPRLMKQIPAAGGKVARIRLIPPQLEDVFISLLEKNDESNS